MTVGSRSLWLPKQSKKNVLTPNNQNIWLDVSEVYRPELNTNLRKFEYNEADPIMKRVYETYVDMHSKQTVAFVEEKKKLWGRFDHAEMDILPALELLNSFIDHSDPDVDVPNIVHAFQTAERAREAHPNEDWFHLTALVHDLGKVMGMWGEPQWCVVGDTFVVGCQPPPSVVFKDTTFAGNPDITDPRYNTANGMYEAKCGLAKVDVSWGHDEYMYTVLRNHKGCTLPEEGLYMIRFHSLYPWHTGGDYWHLCNEKDKELYYWIKEFNKYDLYSKVDEPPKIEELKPYYQGLIDKYIPGKVRF